MMSRPVVRGLWALVIGAGVLGCSRPATVDVSPKELLLRDANGSKNLAVTVLDQKGRAMDKVKLGFSSSAPEVADVDPSGKVTAHSSGEAVVTVAAGKALGVAKVHVRIVSGLKIKLPEPGAVGPAGTVIPVLAKATNDRGEETDLEGITFRSSAPAVASVDGAGRLTLASTGKTILTASIGKAEASLPLDVVVEVPAAVKVEKPVQSFPLGETQSLDFTVLSDQGRPMAIPVTCSSSDEKVATADPRGQLTGHARGTAVITVAAGTASNTIKVVVR